MKQGETYFRVSTDEETAEVDLDEYVLRTIRGKFGYLVLKASFTWGKRSKKHGDFGWLDPVPGWCRERFRISNGIPSGFSSTKRGAFEEAIKKEHQFKDEGFVVELSDKILKNLEARMMRQRR